MGLMDKLKGLFSSRPDAALLEIAVRCNRCKEIIKGQIHLANDLSIQYDGDDTYYFCRKGLVGTGTNRCFQEVIVEYTFDAHRNVIDRRVEGGQFVDQEV